MHKLIFIILIFIFFGCSNYEKDPLKNDYDNIEILFDKIGTGKIIKNHYKVTAHYKGYFENGDEFENSFINKKPITFQIGLRQVIPGWDIGILGMREGGIRKIRIPPSLAYGKNGVVNLIPSNSTLIFEIEVIKAIPPKYIEIDSDDLLFLKNEKLITLINQSFIIIDIRTKNEKNNTGKIRNSYEIIAFDEKGNLNPNFIKTFKLKVKDNFHIILVSQKGDISAILANGLIENLGMKRIYTLKGGIEEWIQKGNEVKK